MHDCSLNPHNQLFVSISIIIKALYYFKENIIFYHYILFIW